MWRVGDGAAKLVLVSHVLEAQGGSIGPSVWGNSSGGSRRGGGGGGGDGEPGTGCDPQALLPPATSAGGSFDRPAGKPAPHGRPLLFYSVCSGDGAPTSVRCLGDDGRSANVQVSCRSGALYTHNFVHLGVMPARQGKCMEQAIGCCAERCKE